MLHIDDPYLAWCVDDAVYEFGTACEEAMESARGNKKGTAAQKNGAAENALRRMLGVRQKYRDITELVNKRG